MRLVAKSMLPVCAGRTTESASTGARAERRSKRRTHLHRLGVGVVLDATDVTVLLQRPGPDAELAAGCERSEEGGRGGGRARDDDEVSRGPLLALGPSRGALKGTKDAPTPKRRKSPRA